MVCFPPGSVALRKCSARNAVRWSQPMIWPRSSQRMQRQAARPAQGLGGRLDLLEAGAGADRSGLEPGDFESVVLDRIVAGGGLDAAQRAHVINRKIHERRVAHAQVNDVEPGGPDAVA